METGTEEIIYILVNIHILYYYTLYMYMNLYIILIFGTYNLFNCRTLEINIKASTLKYWNGIFTVSVTGNAFDSHHEGGGVEGVWLGTTKITYFE